MRNRRNLYRLLHVQRDAPAAVIKASYRTMMQKLRYHPDLGGDDWNAALLNEAMATLGDPVSRAAYDEGQHLATDNDATTPTATSSARRCPFCDAPAPESARSSRATGYAARATCVRCGGPTESVARLASSVAADRRRIHRSDDAGTATVWRRWPLDEPVVAHVADLSISGCALDTDVEFVPDGVILLDTLPLAAIGEVRTCRALAGTARHRVGVAFLTVRMLASPGTFCSATA